MSLYDEIMDSILEKNAGYSVYDELEYLLESREELLKTAEAIADEIDDIDYELEKVAANSRLVEGAAKGVAKNRGIPKLLPAPAEEWRRVHGAPNFELRGEFAQEAARNALNPRRALPEGTRALVPVPEGGAVARFSRAEPRVPVEVQNNNPVRVILEDLGSREHTPSRGGSESDALRDMIDQLRVQKDLSVERANRLEKEKALASRSAKNMRRNAYIAGGFGAAGVGGGTYYGYRQRKKRKEREKALMDRGLISRILNSPV